ncbi:hypothetical protein BB559_002325 [Furculomyces boomerangus]|uniref:Sulfite efflux pump SSU1 n=1 Tax=Furculomyces boomerangus TaxID=61424 RepID=A0A2T9YWF8_9FUNG|nr:hypothetical protein BB559_002325 [Furculomyces boomerangus]
MKPRKMIELLEDPTASLFLGAIPMGLSTIVNGTVGLFPKSQYPHTPNIALFLWGIELFFSMFSYFVVPMYSLFIHKNTIDKLSPYCMLPMVPLIVSSAAGTAIAEILDPDRAHIVLLFSYLFWGMGTVCYIYVPTYLVRLYLYGYPPKEMLITIFITVGLFGQSANAIMRMGHNSAKLFPITVPQVPYLGQACEVCGMVIGLPLDGFAAFFLIQSVGSIWYTFSRNETKFNLSWWGVIYPVGTFNLGMLSLADSLNSMAFRVFSSFIIISLATIWIYVFQKTIYGVWTGKIFVTPPPLPTTVRKYEQSP